MEYILEPWCSNYKLELLDAKNAQARLGSKFFRPYLVGPKKSNLEILKA
jgi:hypothetical protein